MTLRTTEVGHEGFLDGDRELSRPLYELASTDNLDVLLAVLPPRISEAVAEAEPIAEPEAVQAEPEAPGRLR